MVAIRSITLGLQRICIEEIDSFRYRGQLIVRGLTERRSGTLTQELLQAKVVMSFIIYLCVKKRKLKSWVLILIKNCNFIFPVIWVKFKIRIRYLLASMRSFTFLFRRFYCNYPPLWRKEICLSLLIAITFVLKSKI